MGIAPVPEGFHTATPYLLVDGVAKLLAFLTQAFDAEVLVNMPGPAGKIMHAQVRIGDSMIMMGDGAAGGPWEPTPGMVYLYLEDVDATYKRALAAGAATVMEPADQFYGDRMGGVKDVTGNTWWISTHIEDVSPQEMERRHEEAMKQGGGHEKAE